MGVAIDSIEDMPVLLGGLPLDKVSTSMTINSTAAILCLYVAVAEEQGVARAELRGTVQNDILKEYIARGTYIYPPSRPSASSRTRSRGARANAQWNTISISGYHIREAGRSRAGARVHARRRDRLREGRGRRRARRRLVRPQLSFFFNVHNNLIEEIAKFRAARRMWSAIMRDRFGATTEGARAAVPLPDRRDDADRAAAARQRRACHGPDARGRPRRLPVAPYELVRRGARLPTSRRRRSRSGRSRSSRPRRVRRTPPIRSAAPTSSRR